MKVFKCTLFNNKLSDMRYLLNHKSIVVLAILIMTGCQEDNESYRIPPTTVVVDPILNSRTELDPFVALFLEEAEARGKNPNNSLGELLNTLTIEFNDGLNDYCGYGRFSLSGIPSVEISTRDICWRDRDQISREALIFHELGHAVLQRPHLDSTLPNGMLKSLMNTNRQFGLYESDSKERTYYIDELFDINAPVPDWAD